MKRSVSKASAGLIILLLVACGAAAARDVTSRREVAVASSAKAVHALFVESDSSAAREAAAEALALAPSGGAQPVTPGWLLDALFVQMESAAVQADTHAELDAALRLCEAHARADDSRVSIAAARILDLASNTADFRAALPRIQSLLKNAPAGTSDLRASLLSAAADGVPGLSTLELARGSGLITDWKIAGPFGELPNVGFDQVWEPERDSLALPRYGERYVEQFRFDTGNVVLPSYLSPDGDFYAAAELKVASSGEWLVRVESPGTVRVWVDADAVLTKDDRFEATPETVGERVQLRAGTHTVLVKFLPSATPFRVALLASSPATAKRPPAKVASEVPKAYMEAAQDFWAGDYVRAAKEIASLRETQNSAISALLLAETKSRLGQDAAGRLELLKAALVADPSAQAASLEIAADALIQGDNEEAFGRARNVLEAQPRQESAARILAEAASRLGRREDAERGFEIAAQLHPSCAILKDAAAFFDKESDYAHAEQYEAQLRNCAPDSLAWAEALAKAGRHGEAASAAEKVITSNPLDRNAREMLVREQTAAGNFEAARETAAELVALAPNSSQFRMMAAELDQGGEGDPGTAHTSTTGQFFSAYRRDGIETNRKLADNKFSGGPAVLLLNDRVARVGPNGSASVYVHKMTRVLDRDGILRYGEVSLPSDAEVLELRTIKSDGTIVEPEFTQHKSTVSMPSLAPGDAIDVEYVVWDLDGGMSDHPGDFQFTFGTFSMPIVLSRFVLISPVGDKIRFVPMGDVPSVEVAVEGSTVTRTWERNDIAQSNSEASMPQSGVLPSISVFAEQEGGWAGVRDYYREEFIEASKVNNVVESAARDFSGVTDEERLRAAYRFVTTRIRRGDVDYEEGDIPSASSTLNSFTGSRTATLLALGRALGISGEVMMARDVAPQRPTVPSPHSYTHPLLVFHVRAAEGTIRDIVVDAETEGMGFGGVAAALERNDALVVPVFQATTTPSIGSVPEPLLSDHSVAEGDVSFDNAGNLSAHLIIQMGATRGAQMRGTLAGIDPTERRRFFEQLAGRIFPGVNYAEGRAENEFDPDHELKLIVDCRATGFANFNEKTTELEQLVPGLGLRSMYSTGSSRRTPLLIQTPLIETATFHIHLPQGLRFRPQFHDVVEKTEFGSYSVTFKESDPNMIEVRRAFDIPVQIVEPQQFKSFAQFADNVDDAERQRLTVEHADAGRVARR